MMTSEKSQQNLSDYNQFLFKNQWKLIKKHIFSSEKISKSGNCIHDMGAGKGRGGTCPPPWNFKIIIVYKSNMYYL